MAPRLGGALTALALAAALLSQAACAVNPATGKRQLMVISDREEMQIGKQADREVRQENGIYAEKPELVEYVAGVGSKLASRSDRKDLRYQFAIMDSPVVNAFALPGGFVYINRGILDRMNSEDELAAVLGHEIGHVAARHSASQLSKAYAAQFGLIGLAVFSDPRYESELGQLTNLALALAFQGYSREYERQADELGVVYAKRAGYNPKGAVDLLKMLKRLEGDDPSRVEMWFASHPRTSERIANVREELQSLKSSSSEALARPIRHEEYLRKIDGMALGQFNKIGYVSGGRYVDKRDRLSIEIPKGWTVGLGEGDRVLILSRPSDGYRADLRVQDMLVHGVAADAAQDYAKDAPRDSLEVVGSLMSATLPVGEAAVMHLRGKDRRGGTVDVRKLFLVRFDRKTVLTFVVPADKAETTTQTFMDLAGSILYPSSSELASFPEPRLALYRAKPGDTWTSIARKEIGKGASAEKLAAYNGRDKDEQPEPEMLLKVPPNSALVSSE